MIRLIYPWVSNKVDAFESLLVANNYGDDEASIKLVARRHDGETEVTERTIPARGFLREYARTLFPGLGGGSGYAIVLETASDTVHGRWLTINQQSKYLSLGQNVAIPLPEPGQANEQVGRELFAGFLPVTYGAISPAVLVNVGDGPTTVELTFSKGNGETVATARLEDVAPMLPRVIKTNDLVPSDKGPDADDVTLIASSDRQPICAVAFTFTPNSELAMVNVSAINRQTTDSGTKKLVFPWVSSKGAFQSLLIVDNYADREANLSLTARTEQGVSAAAGIVIPPGGFVATLSAELFPSLKEYSYCVEVNADTSKVLGQWVTFLFDGDKTSPSQALAIEGASAPSNWGLGDTLLFGFLPRTEGFLASPVVINAGNKATDVTLYFYDALGREIFRDESTLVGMLPNIPFTRLVPDLIPGESGDLAMVAKSSDGTALTGVGFVFNKDTDPSIGNATAIEFNP